MKNYDASITLIAQKANVSAMTVSRVLRGYKPSRQAAAQRAERIRNIAAELGYRKHSAPLAMRRGRYNTVAVLGSSILERNGLPAMRESGIIGELNKHDIKLLVARDPDERLVDPDFMPSILSERMTDGLLIDYIRGIPEAMESMLISYNLPVIWMNTKHQHDCIYYDDYNASFQATEHLLKAGHRRIVYWNGKPRPNDTEPHYSIGERAVGYRAAMKQAGYTPEVIDYRMDDDNPLLPEGILAMVKQDDRPTAFITYCVNYAMSLIATLPYLKLRTPDDIELMTYCSDRNQTKTLMLNSMITPEYEMGAQAVQLLLQKIAAPTIKLDPVILPLGKSICRLPDIMHLNRV